MNTQRIWSGILAAALCAGLVGCVDPGSIEATAVNRYQEELLRRAHQERLGKDPNELLPVPGEGVPPLRVEKNPEGEGVVIQLPLRGAVLRALANNLEVRVISFDPAIAREDMVQAAAVFDYIVFGSAGYSETDLRLNSAAQRATRTKTRSVEAGLRNRTVTGADVTVAYRLEREATNAAGARLPTFYEPTFALELTQPLLRNAWSTVNLATLRVARLNRRISEEAFRQQVEDIVTQVVSTYWRLVQARRDVEIQEELLAKTKETQQRVEARAELDATAVQVKQTEAAVETRRAVLIRARKTILDVQDELVRLVADNEFRPMRAYELVPATPPQDSLLRIEQVDQLLVALKSNPVLQQARLAIDSADIGVTVAENQLLPRLDLRASSSMQGLDRGTTTGHDQVLDSKYHSWAVGLELEYPLGNRDAEAGLRSARFERLKAIATVRNLSLQVAQSVKERIRQIETTFEEMKAQKAAVAAAAIQLQALEDTEKIRGRLSPEFLQVKLDAQRTLAIAQRSELEALVNYNTAMVTLSQVTGTVLKQYGVELAEIYQSGQAEPSQ